jgi:sec-independent protein translocase protein TatA
VTLAGGSNGCSVVTRIAVEQPDRVARLVLAEGRRSGPSEFPRVSAFLRQNPRSRRPDGRIVGGVTDLGWPELLIVAVIAMMLFGSKKMPDVARSLGRSMRIVKAELKGLKEDDAVATQPLAVQPVVVEPVVVEPIAPIAPVTGDIPTR